MYYEIRSGSEPVSGLSQSPGDDFELAKSLARDISRDHGGETVSVVSHIPQASGEWTGTSAAFVNGREVDPANGRVPNLDADFPRD